MNRINWFNTLFLIFFPVATVLGLIFYFQTEVFNPWLLLLLVVFYFLTGLSITAGYHRLFAHKAYDTHPLVEWLYLIFGAAAFENSALRWCEDHRVHHRFIDQERDPYNIQKGFWHAHIGWIMVNQEKHKDNALFSRDLARNPRIAFQHKYYLLIAILSGVALPVAIGALMGSAVGGFVFGFVIRVTLVHHFTFFINSLCHMWGWQTYSDKDSSKDNAILAFFTYGEGYHNFHHLFHNDYRNGIKWYHFDPSKWLIRTLASARLAYNLKRASKVDIMAAKLQMQKKKSHDHLHKFPQMKEKFHHKIESMHESLTASIQHLHEIQDSYRLAYQDFKARKSEEAHQKLMSLRLDMQLAKIEYKRKYVEWKLTLRSLSELQLQTV